MCVTRHLVEEVEPKSIVLKTSTALRVNGACVSQDTLGLRGRASVDRAQDLDGAASMRRVCVTRHTGGAAIMQRMCVSQDTPGLRGRADVLRAQDLDSCEHAARVCHQTHQRRCDKAAYVCVTRHTWSRR